MTTYNQSGERVDAGDETMVHRGGLDEPGYSEGIPYSEEPLFSETRQRSRYGGFNWGADFLGWLVTFAVALLLSGGLAAVVTTLGVSRSALSGDAAGGPPTLGIAAAAIVLGVLMMAYYVGGYVAGRMCRFDGGKQGAGVWLTGLLVIGAAAAFALLFGPGYDVLDTIRGSLPTLPAEAPAVAGVVAAVLTLLAAVAGGRVGCRYHEKVDDAGYL